jgi:hypothetical protein
MNFPSKLEQSDGSESWPSTLTLEIKTAAVNSACRFLFSRLMSAKASATSVIAIAISPTPKNAKNSVKTMVFESPLPLKSP